MLEVEGPALEGGGVEGVVDEVVAGFEDLLVQVLFSALIDGSGTGGEEFHNDVGVAPVFFPDDPALAGRIGGGVEHYKEVWSSEILVTHLATAVVDEHIAASEVILAIAPVMLERSDQGVHGNPVAVAFQGFSVVKD